MKLHWHRVAAAAAVAVAVLLSGCSLVTAPINFVASQFQHETKVDYTVRDADSLTPIIGARIELFALETGGDPRFDESFETTPDAVVVTEETGKATLRVVPTPNEPRDQIIRPSTLYRVVVTAPGFDSVSTSLAPLNEGMGNTPKSLDLEREA